MKANISKNARTDRKSKEKLKYNDREIEPVVVYAHFVGKGKFKAAIYSDTKEFVKLGEDLLTWAQVVFLIKKQGKKSS